MDKPDAIPLWIGAGVIPFAVDDKTGDVLVLLGKENNAPNWKMRSNKWCDFSGGRDQADTDVETTAAREYFEETSALPYLWPSGSYESFYQSLKDGSGYLYKLDRISPGTREYPTFLCRTQFVPQLAKYFDTHRNRLIELKKKLRAYETLLATCPASVTETNKQMLTLGHEYVDGSGTVVDMFVHESTVIATVVGPTESNELIWTPESEVDLNWAYDVCTARKAFIDFYLNVVGPTPACQLVTLNNHIIDMQVIDCYIEKQRIEWYSIDWIRDMIANGGTFGTESFRSSFIPMLSVLLDIFCSRIPNHLRPKKTQYVIDVRLWSMSTTLFTSNNKAIA